jgi:hypothetical protein
MGAIIYLTVSAALGSYLSITMIPTPKNADNTTTLISVESPNNFSGVVDPRNPFLEINGTINVKSGGPWIAMVEDVDPATRGHLTEWNGTSYRSRRLEYPLNVSASREVTLPKGAIIQTGTETKALGNNFNVTFRQRTSWNDEPLQGDSVYRIIATFRVSPLI